MTFESTYYPEVCKELLDWFQNEQKPTIENFCKEHEISVSTFYHWLKIHPDLLEAKERCWELRRESFLNEVEQMIETGKETKINSFPLALIARRYGIKTKDDSNLEDLTKALNSLTINRNIINDDSKK